MNYEEEMKTIEGNNAMLALYRASHPQQWQRLLWYYDGYCNFTLNGRADAGDPTAMTLDALYAALAGVEHAVVARIDEDRQRVLRARLETLIQRGQTAPDADWRERAMLTVSRVWDWVEAHDIAGQSEASRLGEDDE